MTLTGDMAWLLQQAERHTRGRIEVETVRSKRQGRRVRMMLMHDDPEPALQGVGRQSSDAARALRNTIARDLAA